jgi:hypothetical protein
MTGLKELAVDGTRITAEGLQRLRAALPDCIVSPAAIDSSQDRAAAIAVLEHGGTVRAVANGNELEISTTSKLPNIPLRLVGISLDSRPVEDADLDPLAGLTALTNLNLSQTHVSDRGVAKLTGLRQLQHLSLYGTSIGAGCMENIGRLTELRSLSVGNTGIGESGWDRLRTLTKLETISLGMSGVADTNLAMLAGLPVTSLKASGARKLTAAGVANLSAFPRLQRLDLTDCTGIGDDAVEPLGRLTGLTLLNLTGGGVTAAGRARIRAALPKCDVQPKD